MTEDTHVSSHGNGTVDPTISAVKVVSSDCNGNGSIIHSSQDDGVAGLSGEGRLGIVIPRDDTDDNSYVFVTGIDDSPVAVSLPLDDDDHDEHNKEDPNGNIRDPSMDLPNGKLDPISSDHASPDKANDGTDAPSQDFLNKSNHNTDELPVATQMIHQNGAVGEINAEPSPVSWQDHQDPEVAASVLESKSIVDGFFSTKLNLNTSHSPATNQQNDGTHSIPAATQVIDQNETVEDSALDQLVHNEISPKPSPASRPDTQESESTASVLGSDEYLVDSHQPDLAVSLDVTKSIDEENLVSIRSKSPETDIQSASTNQPDDEADGVPVATQEIQQNGTLEDSAFHQVVNHEIDSKLSPAPRQDSQHPGFATSVLVSHVDLVDCHEPDSEVLTHATKLSDVSRESPEAILVSINSKLSETDVTEVIPQNGKVDDTSLQQLVHYENDPKPSPAPEQDNQEPEVSASVLELNADLFNSHQPDSVVLLDFIQSSNVYHEPQEENLVSDGKKLPEDDVTQSTFTNQQNLESLDEFAGPQESENACSIVQLDTESVNLVKGRPAVLEQLESSPFDQSEQRIEEEKAEENQKTIFETGENGLSNLDQGSETERSVCEVDLLGKSSAKELDEHTDERERSAELDESSTHNEALSPTPICQHKETDTVGEPVETPENVQESIGEHKFQHGAYPLANATVDQACNPETKDPVNASVQSLDKLPDIPEGQEIEVEASVVAENIVINTGKVIELETDVTSAISSDVSNGMSEISEDVNGNDLGEIIQKHSIDSTTTGTEFEVGIAESGEKVLSYEVDVAHDIAEVGILDVECANTHFVSSHTELKPETEDMNCSGLDSEEILHDSALASKLEVSDSSVVPDTNVTNSISEMKDTKNKEDQLPVTDIQNDDKQRGQEGENSENKASTSLLESSLAGQDVAVGLLTRPFQFLIRMPRFDDSEVRERIKHAQLVVDEKTKIRDGFRFEIQKLRATCHGSAAEYETAVSKARSSKRSVKSKRAEIDSLQVVINKVKNAMSVDDIDARIYSMEHMMQHETLPLKEEKQFIREIKQLKQLREQLSSNIGNQDEVRQALNEREETEERLKILKKELDHLKDGVLKAETVARAAQKKYDDENRKLKELVAQFEEANDIRQSAYLDLQCLRKELFEKNRLFRSYKDDAAAASHFAASRDTEALHHLCQNQVEIIMDLWNKDDEFREEYVKSNVRSTVRRLGTLDGRSLGPDEEPPVLASLSSERWGRSISSQSNTSSVVEAPVGKQVNGIKTVEEVSAGDLKRVGEGKNQTAKTGEVAKHSPMSISGRGEETREKEYIPTKEELEFGRKAEELRKQERAAKRREEEKVKAVEALERKKKVAEKAQMRAEVRAQKEAEQKEKEREKRLRKKERKKWGCGSENGDGNNNGGESSPPRCENGTETTRESSEMKESVGAGSKASSAGAGAGAGVSSKQSKTKAGIPPALRNRSKRKMQQWMWVIVTCMLVIFLFVLGNVGFFSNISNLRQRNYSI